MNPNIEDDSSLIRKLTIDKSKLQSENVTLKKEIKNNNERIKLLETIVRDYTFKIWDLEKKYNHNPLDDRDGIDKIIQEVKKDALE